MGINNTDNSHFKGLIQITFNLTKAQGGGLSAHLKRILKLSIIFLAEIIQLLRI